MNYSGNPLRYRVFYHLFVSSVCLVFLLAGHPAFSYPSGSPAGYTGSPGDGKHCVQCHGGSASTVNDWILTNIPAQGYTAGVTYDITVTVSGTGKKGFEISPQDPSGVQLGTLAAGAGSHLVGGSKYVTQNSSGSSSSTVSWTFPWTAPASGTGQVTFYGAFTVGKTVTKLSTLVVGENSAVPLSATATASPSPVCSGGQIQLSAFPAGGSGNYTFEWSSVPPGFSSTLQNPVANPLQNTLYTVHVTDGSSTADAGADVSVTQPPTAWSGNDTTCQGTTVSLPLSGTATNYAAISWGTSGTGTFTAPATLSGEYLPSAGDIAAGTVTLTLTALPMAPCAAVTDERVVSFEGPSGVGDEAGNLRIVLSPNPSPGNVAILFSPAGTGVNVTVSDLSGRTLGRFSSVQSGQSLDLGHCQPGIYVLRVETPGGCFLRKLVRE